MKDYKNITFRYLKVQKKKTVLTLIGIILSVALISAIGTMIVSMRDKLIKDTISDGGDYHAIFQRVEADKVNKVRNHTEISNSAVVSPEGDAIISKLNATEKNPEAPAYRYLSVKGYDSDALKMIPIELKEGRLPQSPSEISLEYWVLDYLPDKPKLGDKIKLNLGVRLDKTTGREMSNNSWSTEWSSEEVFRPGADGEFTVVGLIKPRIAVPGGYFANGITFVDSKNLLPDKKYNIYVKLNSLKDVQTRVTRIAGDAGLPPTEAGSVAPSGSSQTVMATNTPQIEFNDRLLRLSAQSLDKSMNEGLTLILGFLIALIMVSTVAVIYNAFNISVLERISQFGLLRGIGASPHQIKAIVLREAAILSAAGIPLGLVTGVYGVKVVLLAVSGFKFEPFIDLPIVVSPLVLIISAGLGALTVYLSAFGPACRAGRISPLEAVRNAGSFKKEKFKIVKGSRLARLLFGIAGDIAFKNLRRNRARFRITVFSMVISITLYIIFGSFVSSLLKIGVIQNQVGDFSLWVNGLDGDGVASVTYSEIKNIPGVQTAFKTMTESVAIMVPEAEVNPRFSQLRSEAVQDKTGDKVLLPNNLLLSYGDAGLAEAKQYLRQGSIDLDALNKENGVLLVETDRVRDEKRKRDVILDVVQLKVGDVIPLRTQGRERNQDFSKTVKVLGILDKGILDNEYNNNGGTLLITTEQVYQNLTGKNSFKRVIINLKPDASREPITHYLDQLKERDPRYQYLDSSEQARRDRNSALAISVFLYGFVAIIALIGSLNIVNTISTSLVLRTKELSVLQAVGITFGGLKKMVSLEGIFYGVIAAFYGGLLGSGLSYLLYRFVIDIREFEWSVPWIHIITAVVGAVIIALLSGYLPLLKLKKGNLMDNIRMEV
jgi:putative ABC transport system permease protein